MAVVAGLLLAGAVSAAPAVADSAQSGDTDAVMALAGEVAAELREDPLLVDPDAEAALDDAEAADLRAQLAQVRAEAGEIFIAILPASAAASQQEFATLLTAIGQEVDRPGTYALIVGDSLLAGATADAPVDPGVVPDIATETVQAERGNGAAAVLSSFVDRVAAAADAPPAEDGEPAPADGGGVPWLPLLLVAAGGGALLVGGGVARRRRAAEDAAHVAELRRLALDDLVVLGEELRDIDVATQLPGASEAARSRYRAALDAYTDASDRLDATTRPAEVAQVTARIDEGRHEVAAARALLEGREVPERRPPCFFDPRHGPSVSDVEWTPPGGAARQVPVCAADATRLADGDAPAAREIEVDGRRVPYWNAPAWYGPWAGGYYGMAPGLLHGLVIGSLLSGGWGGGWGGGAGDDGWRGGDFGGGDFGGFGGFGGGDFGGGDFGGGDFGGGDFG